jgi:molybdenum cofactor synthesis domain-containing protein
VKIGILTISDTRDVASDSSGQVIADFLSAHELTRKIVRDELTDIQAMLAELTACDVIITTGGTGIARRDVTFEALAPLIATEIPGFGELFRQLSFAEIGTHALASRALAFFDADNRLIFALPGSTNAVTLAMKQLILPEMAHLIKERRK